MTTIAMRYGSRYPAIGFPEESTSRALAVPQDSRRTVTGPPEPDLPERFDHGTQPSLRFEKEDGDLGIGCQAMQLEPAVAYVTVVVSLPGTPRHPARHQDESGSPSGHPGPAVRPGR